MSINLTSTNHKLKVITSTAVQTQVSASARDNVSGVQTPISQDTNITSATTTDIVAVPGASTQRLVDDVEINIVGSGSQQVTVQKDVGGTVFQLLNVILGGSDRIHYTNDQGWRVFSSSGAERGNTVAYALMTPPTLVNTGTTGTITPNVGCTALLLEIWGAGGQGGGSLATTAGNASSGAGGSAGCYTRKFLIGVPSSFTYSLGVGGSTGTGTTAGQAGTATTVLINGVTYTANGGPGGSVGTTGAATGQTGASPAAGSVAGTNGDDALAGEVGSPGQRVTSIAAIGGNGGLCALQNGSPGFGSMAISAAATAGGAATGNGNGGGGGSALNLTGSAAGGVGTLGAFRYWQFSG